MSDKSRGIVPVQSNGQGMAELQNFSNFVISSMISHCATEGHLYGSGALMRSQPDQFCGIGMFCPMSEDERSRYRSMALAQAIDMEGYTVPLFNVSRVNFRGT